MIYLKEQTENRSEFENLLQRTKELTLQEIRKLETPALLNGVEFEEMVYNAAVTNSKGTAFEGKLEHTDDTAFPDIIALGYFGIEVKATKGNKWTSVGNSVLESTRNKTVEKIYMFFGKLGGDLDVTYRPYEDCLKGIAVTHYPRYLIDMNLKDGESIFDKMDTSYDLIKNSTNPVQPIRAYYKSKLKEGQGLWWIGDDLDESATTSPVIRTLSTLSTEMKDAIKAEEFILFPEILSSSTKKYERLPAFLAASYGVVTSNIRDQFSAGGQETIKVNDKELRIPQILVELRRLAQEIKKHLEEKTIDQLEDSWSKKLDKNLSAEQAWMTEIDSQCAYLNLEVQASKLFIDAL